MSVIGTGTRRNRRCNDLPTSRRVAHIVGTAVVLLTSIRARPGPLRELSVNQRRSGRRAQALLRRGAAAATTRCPRTLADTVAEVHSRHRRRRRSLTASQARTVVCSSSRRRRGALRRLSRSAAAIRVRSASIACASVEHPSKAGDEAGVAGRRCAAAGAAGKTIKGEGSDAARVVSCPLPRERVVGSTCLTERIPRCKARKIAASLSARASGGRRPAGSPSSR